MKEKIFFLLFIFLAVFLEVVADILFKKWSFENKKLLLIVGLVLYFVGTIFWAFSLKHEFLSKAVSVFTILNLMLVVGVGVFYFKENFSLLNKIGIGLGIISIIFLEFF